MLDKDLERILEICNLNISVHDPGKANNLYLKAKKLSKKEKWVKVEPLIRQAIEYNPFEFGYWILFNLCLRALIMKGIGDRYVTESVSSYTFGRVDMNGMRKLVDNLKYFEELEQESAINLRDGRWVEAEQGFRKLLEMKASNPEAFKGYTDSVSGLEMDFMYWSGIAIATDNLNKKEEAEEAFRKSIELNPDEFTTWLFFGNFLVENSRFDEAITVFQKALKIDKTASEAWYGLGSCFFNQNKLEEALEPLKNAIKYDKTNFPAVELLNECKERLE